MLYLGESGVKLSHPSIHPHTLGWEIIHEKKKENIEQVTIQIKNDYMKHPYQYSTYLTLYYL